MAKIPVRFKRITAALDDDARARLCQSSGSDYSTAANSVTELSDLVDSFFDGEDDVGGESEVMDNMEDYTEYDRGTERFYGTDYTEMKEMLIDLMICGSTDEEDDRARCLIRCEVESVCRNCENSWSEGFKRRLMTVLRQRGLDSGICKSRWEKTARHPAGEYEYIDVVISGNRYIVEVSFGSEFTIARPTETYKSLLEIIPKITVIKPNELKKVLRLICAEMRASLKNRGMTVSPWRKNGYMQKKWLGSYKRMINPLPSSVSVEVTTVTGNREFDGESFLGFEYSPAALGGGKSYCRKEVGRMHVVGNLKALMLRGMS